MRATIISLAALWWGATPAAAQSRFTGPYAGAAVAAADHHFAIEEFQPASGATRQFNVTRWGAGAQLFAGYDLAVAPRVIVGVQGALDFGGRTAIERNSSYVAGIDPKHGFSVTARAGFVATARLLLYAGGGYGGHDYRAIIVRAQDLADLSRSRSFVLRAGGEYRLTRRIAVRAEFEHLDGSRNQILIGVPIRF